nr:VRR-NUC domain-containing protein [Trueperella pecoris]
MRETVVEQALSKAVRTHGGLCWKFTSPGTVGVPDRIIILPGGHVGFVEVKAPGQKPRPIQTHRHNQLHALGANVYTIDHPNQIQGILNEIQTA